MSYFYKQFELPEYKDTNWHTLVLPLFEWTIDQNILNDYIPISLEEVGYIVYVGKEKTNSSDWLIKKVIDNQDGTYTTNWATNVNNPLYTNITQAMINKGILVYESTYLGII